MTDDHVSVRLAALDIEASAFDDVDSYPVKIAIALDDGAARSRLVRPTDAWLEHGIWSDASQEVHRLSLDDLLRNGQPVADVAQDLAEFVVGCVVVSDAHRADAKWTNRLYAAAHRRPPFQVECFWFHAHALSGLGWPGESGVPPNVAVEAAMARARALVPEEHRALPDALRLREALRVLRAEAGS